MLVITVREHDEIVLVREGVELGRIDVRLKRDGRARVAIDLPRDIKIIRREVAAREEAK